MCLATLLFVTSDTLIKHMLSIYPAPLLVWGRYLFHVIILYGWLSRRLPRTLAVTTSPGLQILRSLLLAFATAMFYTGLKTIPLAEANAILFLAPLLVTALSVPILAEQVGLRRWLGVVVGFLGALIVIRPGSEVFQVQSLLPLGAAVCFALFQIITRRLSVRDSTLTTMAFTPIAGFLVFSALVPLFWVWPDPVAWMMMGVTGCFGILIHLCFIRAFSAAPASVVAPYTYIGMIWATVYGYVLFDEFPDIWTGVGAVVIVAAGLYIIHRERVRKDGEG